MLIAELDHLKNERIQLLERECNHFDEQIRQVSYTIKVIFLHCNSVTY